MLIVRGEGLYTKYILIALSLIRENAKSIILKLFVTFIKKINYT